MNKETAEIYVKSVCPHYCPSVSWEIGPARLWRLAGDHPELAADTILNKEVVGRLEKLLTEALSLIAVDLVTLGHESRERICQTFLEIIFNLVGLESKRVGFSEEETQRTLQVITEFLSNWEKTQYGKSALEVSIAKILRNMKQVAKGNSMVARMAENIERNLDVENLAETFVRAVKKEIQKNVYYQMADREMGKFGNDSATGLRVVRHFDFVQVSSNPVISARAYEEFPNLWEDFGEIVPANPRWQEDPEKYGDEIALQGTIVALLPNLLIFRPIALLSDFHDGLVSYQLNPLKAASAKASIADAEKICSILREILYRYDAWLGWDPDKYEGRPNIVFKVAACSQAAIPITVGLNKRGIGSNDTVTYSVSQEIRLLIAEAEGMALALQRGILPSQVYQTNMIGRTEDHLREVEAERLVSTLGDELFEDLAQGLSPKAEETPQTPQLRGATGQTREEKTKIICSKKFLKSLADQRLISILRRHDPSCQLEQLWQLEKYIENSGIYVTRRVYQLFFSPENRPKWSLYLQRKFGLSEEQADLILDRIDMLPASKRRAGDTYLVLGTPNVTNTEFPNHQLVVWDASWGEAFNLEDYRDSIKAEPDPLALERLLAIEDFVKIYELTPELSRKLKKIGIVGDFGCGGMRPKDWSRYGAVQKTMREFMDAYSDFRQRAMDFVREH